MPVPYLNYSIKTSLQMLVPISTTAQILPFKCQCHISNTPCRLPLKRQCHVPYTTTTSFQMPVPLSQLHHKYFLQNSSVMPQQHHNYFLTNASVIINYTTATSIWMPVRISTTQLLPNASAISQLHHNYFTANNFQFTTALQVNLEYSKLLTEREFNQRSKCWKVSFDFLNLYLTLSLFFRVII